MTSFIWKIKEMACHTQSGENANVVFYAQWVCTATEGSKVESAGADCVLPSPTDSFTPYDQLTEAQVLGWIWASGVNTDAVESNLTQTLASMPNPVSVSLPLPWSNA